MNIRIWILHRCYFLQRSFKIRRCRDLPYEVFWRVKVCTHDGRSNRKNLLFQKLFNIKRLALPNFGSISKARDRYSWPRASLISRFGKQTAFSRMAQLAHFSSIKSISHSLVWKFQLECARSRYFIVLEFDPEC